MNRFSYIFLIANLVVASAVPSMPVESINSDILIKNIDRTIDISSQLAKISQKITLENNGKGSVRSFIFSVEPQFTNKIAYIGGQVGSDMKVHEVKAITQAEGRFWHIDLKDQLHPGKTITVEVEYVLSYVLSPYPTSITQKEKQYVIYNGNHYVYSPYLVSKQTTTVNVGTRNIESYSKQSPVSQSDMLFTYGPYSHIPQFSESRMTIHYENNSPFLSVTYMERTIEVSHWGNIAIEETINLLHNGAQLKGPFSRYEYQREAQSGVSSVKTFKTVLPAAASDAYYRDEIGNISTSHMRVLSDSVELDLRPRFPLFGGWKTHYILGYSVPSYEYLYNSGDDYKLKMRVVDHVFDDMIVDEAVTKVILPEGSHSILISTPYLVQRLPDSLHYTYLDTKGRPVIAIQMRNLVEHHIQDFELSYVFPRILMLQEPFLVVAAFYLLFLFVVVYVRLDLSITKDEIGESRMRVSGICDRVLLHQDKRAITYNTFEAALGKLKQNKDINGFLAAVKVTNQEYKNETAQVSELLTRLRSDASEIAEKVSELQKLDKHLKELYGQQQSLYIDKLVPGKISRGPFMDAENSLNKKKEECFEKMNSIIRSLH